MNQSNPSLSALPSPSSGTTHYDYIFTGAGCAAFSLLLRIIAQPQLKGKSILLIDEQLKNENDRTWCFWEKESGFFEPIVQHRWQQLQFTGNSGLQQLFAAPYTYKMIRGADLYAHAFATLLHSGAAVFAVQARVTNIHATPQSTEVVLPKARYTAQYVFNSIPHFNQSKFAKQPQQIYPLIQHFKGWLIETPEPIFDVSTAVFMDFDVPQNLGTAFVYLLPLAANSALVEYTFFNQQPLSQSQYDALLRQYLQNRGIKKYLIVATEVGAIPMTNRVFAPANNALIHIGTAGGQTKASSGFTFQFIQKHSEAIVQLLANNRPPIVAPSFFHKRFALYDAVLLQVLYYNHLDGKTIFSDILAKQSIQTLFRFLDNESSLLEEIAIMQSVPTNIFLRAAIKEMFN